MTRRACLLTLLACVAAWPQTQAQPRALETRQDRGKRVVYEALSALGGDAFLHMQDRVEIGRAYSFYREELSGLSFATVYTRYIAPAPGTLGQRERDAFGKKLDEGFLLFNEQGAWEVTFRGAAPLEEQRVSNYQITTMRNIFYILRQRLNEPGMTFYSQGSDILENVPVEIVDITDGDGNTVTVYFSKFDKLPMRETYRRRNAQYHDFDTEVSAFSKYRAVSGIQWPYEMRRERNGDKIFEMFADSVEINKGLQDDLFSLPANVKMLPKQP